MLEAAVERMLQLEGEHFHAIQAMRELAKRLDNYLKSATVKKHSVQ